jgi:dipeptidyl aminopeptidase/acylaminoacyl peptidase
VSSEGKFLLISREQNGVLTPALLDLRTKDVALLTAPGWESFPGSFAPDASALTYFVNEDGQMTTYVMDLKTQVAAALPFPPGVTRFSGSAALFSPDGKRLLIEHSNSQAPADLWIYQREDKTPRQLTFSALASLKPSALPASHLVHYRSFDGTIISAFLWLPFNLERNQKHPAVVLAHGGPASQSLASFNRTAAALASRGFLCMAPNVRGSSGYGAAFQKANYQDPGGGDLQDEVYATRFLVATGYVDANRVGITGGSYGGYLTLMALAKTPEVWAAGVEWYGIMDWRTLAQHSDPFIQQYLRGLLGDPEQNRRIYERCSASQYLDGIRAPLLVLQGINDIRVPKEQANQLVSVLQRAGKVVEAHYYENEGHGFVKRENQIDALRRTVDWLEKYLR